MTRSRAGPPRPVRARPRALGGLLPGRPRLAPDPARTRARLRVGAAGFSSGRTHHELLLIEVGRGRHARSRPGRRVGMYHFGLNVGETDDDLRAALTAVQTAGATVVGAADHTVTHSLYILDPDGNEIELYVDVPGVDWQSNPTLVGAADPPAPALTAASRPTLAPAHDRGARSMTGACAPTTTGRRGAAEVLLCRRRSSWWCRPTPSTGWPPARTDADAVRAVYRAKGRPEGMHLPVLAASRGRRCARWAWPSPRGARRWPGAGGRDR